MAHPTPAKPSLAEHATGKTPAVPGAPRAVLPLASVGHFVPRLDFAARVHSVFARACNLQLDVGLVAISAHAGGDGPLQLRLGAGCGWDLRRVFDIGEGASCRGGVLLTQRARLDLRGVAVWPPGAPPPLLVAEVIANNAVHLAALLQRHRPALRAERGAGGSQLFGDLDAGREGPARALVDATRALDSVVAVSLLWRLVGWGEGLTPAGDDFIAGWLAGLQRLAGAREPRRSFVDAAAAAVDALAERTTTIAAQMLRLASRGEHGSLLLGARDALLSEGDAGRRDAAWQALLALGASSGADMACGLLAAVQGWLGTASSSEPAP